MKKTRKNTKKAKKHEKRAGCVWMWLALGWLVLWLAGPEVCWLCSSLALWLAGCGRRGGCVWRAMVGWLSLAGWLALAGWLWLPSWLSLAGRLTA